SFIGLLSGYLFTLFIARNFGASVNGLIGLSLSILMMTCVIGLMGIDVNLVKFYSDDNKFRQDQGFFYKMLFKAFITCSLLGLILHFFRESIALTIFKKPELI